MRLITGLSKKHQRPTVTRKERLSFVVTLAGSAAAVSVEESMRSVEIVLTMGGAPERLFQLQVRAEVKRSYLLSPKGNTY